MTDEIKAKINELVKLMMIPGGTNVAYEALQDFRIKAQKQDQWDMFLEPIKEAEEIVFEIMMIQKGNT